MKKSVASMAMAASLVGGSVAGVALFTPTIAGAQDAEQPADGPSWVDEALAPLIENGTVTQTQADAVVDALAEARPDRAFAGAGRLGRSDVLTDVLGIDEDTLRESLVAGQSLAEVAEANGVDTQTVIDALVAEHQTRLDEAVAEGRIDAAEAAERSADAAERIEAKVNGEAPVGSPGFGSGRPDRFGPPAADDGADEGTSF